MDILQSACKQIVDRSVAAVERPPKDFSKPYDVAVGASAGGALGAIGLLVGSHTGIALFGTAISGAWILAPILGVAGLALGSFSSDDN